MKLLVVFLTFFLIAISSIKCARILGIFPTPSISHQVVFHSLMKELAARGHELTILTTDLIKIENSNVTQIDLHASYDVMRREMNFVEFKDKKKDEVDLMLNFMRMLMIYIDDQLSHPEVKKIIRKDGGQEFDLVIVEHLMYYSMLAFAEVYDCPVIGITSLDTMDSNHEALGNNANPILHPEILFPFTHGALTISERWRSLKYYLTTKFILAPRFEKQLETQIQKHFPNVKTPIGKIKERIQLLMTNTHPAMGFIRPLLPNTINLGFMHIETPKPLPKGELKTFLDNSKNGVIYMSLGSNVQSKDLSSEVLQTLLKAFGSLSFNILWKFEADNLPGKPDNMMISKWLPQSDLLAHPSIKLFITQGGQQSMEEAIDRTIPMIVIPFLGDQDANAKRMEQKGIGHHLDLHTLTQANLIEAINEMLKPKYKENIRNLKDLVNDQPMTSREKAVWWTEYIIRHKGAKHLEYPGRLVPFYQKYWLDFFAIFLISFVSVLIILKKICSIFISSKKIKSE